MKKILLFCTFLFCVGLVQAHEKADTGPDLPDIVNVCDLNADVAPAINSVEVSVESTAVDFINTDHNAAAIITEAPKADASPEYRRQSRRIIYKQMKQKMLKYKRQKIPLLHYR